MHWLDSWDKSRVIRSYTTVANAIGLRLTMEHRDASAGEDAQVIYNAVFRWITQGALRRSNTTHGTSVEKYPTLAQLFGGLDSRRDRVLPSEEEMK